MILFYGMITGILFGILLQKAQVLRYDKQVGALRLKDMTIFKFMLSAIIVACIGIYLLNDLGMIKLNVKPFSIGAQVVGGLIFGIGWGILGYCPGTAGGALGEGGVDAFWGILGMLFGGALYAPAYPFMKKYIIGLGNFGKITIPQAFRMNHWAVIIGFAVFLFFLFRFFEKKGL